MSDTSSESSEDEFNMNFLRKSHSKIFTHPKFRFSMGLWSKDSRRRSSSALVNLPKNFVPKLHPKKTKLCPSPIKLNEKPPPKKFKEELNITTISTSSFDSKNDFKIVKLRKKVKNSFKLINEKVYAISDYEEIDKKEKENTFDSDTNSSKKVDNSKNINLRNIHKINNMKETRAEMMRIRKESNNDNANAIDDSNLRKQWKEKSYNIFKKIKLNFVTNFRTNKSMSSYPLDSIKLRNKSHSNTSRCIPTILGFLERNKSSLSLKSVGKK
jgi:hypothetical protein